jgi:hypothetical protein
VAETVEIIRIIRVIEYVGPRKRVEETVAKSIHGLKDAGTGLLIYGATLGLYGEVIGLAQWEQSQSASTR